jgi:hypothetical protein
MPVRATADNKARQSRSKTMAIDQKTRDALAIENLNLPADLPIVKIEIEEYVDTSGYDALRVYVILKDNVSDECLTGKNMIQLRSAIRESLLAKGIRLFPYVTLRTESERRDERSEGVRSSEP